MAFTPITETDTIDFSAEELVVGDLLEFLTKMSSYMVKIQAQANDIGAAINSINVLGAEMDAAQLSDMVAIEAEINNRIAAVEALQDSINAINTSLDNLTVNDVATLAARLSSIDQTLSSETINRTEADGQINVDIATVQTRIDSLLDITGINLSTLSATATAIQQLLASAGGLTIDSVEGLEDQLIDLEIKIADTTPNIFADHGRFIAPETYFTYDLNTELFDTSAFTDVVVGYNGADLNAAVEVGRFFYNNDNNGGSGGENNPIAQRFAAAMGLDDSRYSPTWCVLEFTTGAGTGSTVYNGHYRMLNTSILTQMLTGLDKTLSLWIESDDTLAFQLLNGADQITYYDGAKSSETSYQIIPAMEVHHLAAWRKMPADTPYTGFLLNPLAKPNTKVRIALAVAKPVFGQLTPNQGVMY